MSNGDILISIRPEWVAKILNGEKKIEVRKTRPKVKTPFKCFIYCTLGKELWGDGTGETWWGDGTGETWWGIDHDENIDEVFRLNPTLTQLNGKVIGEFICNYIAHSNEHLFDENKITMQKLMKSSCLSFEEINNYRGDKNIFAWHISELKIYDNPKKLIDFWHKCKYYDGGCDVMSEICKIEQSGNCKLGYYQIVRPPQSWCYVMEKDYE